MQRNCPDCDVLLNETNYDVNSRLDKIRLKTDGWLGELGLKGTRYVDAYVCPECGLVRFYTDV